jgi:hypothetical protein
MGCLFALPVQGRFRVVFIWSHVLRNALARCDSVSSLFENFTEHFLF